MHWTVGAFEMSDQATLLAVSLSSALLLLAFVFVLRMKNSRREEIKRLVLRTIGNASDQGVSSSDIQDKLMGISGLNVQRGELASIVGDLIASRKIIVRYGDFRSELMIFSLTDEAKEEFKAGMYNRYPERPSAS